MAGLKYSIGEYNFRTKAESYAFTRKKVYDIGVGTILPDHPDYVFFCNLIKEKPDAFHLSPNKMNDKYLELSFENEQVRKVKSWGRCSRFVFKRKKENELTQAMRWGIRDQIRAWSASNQDKRCVACQSVECLHVDHVIPFDMLKTEFLKDRKDQVPETFIRDAEMPFIRLFKVGDVIFEKQWAEYHRSNCKLQFLCKPCNLKKSNKVTSKEWINNNRERYNTYHRERNRRKKKQINQHN